MHVAPAGRLHPNACCSQGLVYVRHHPKLCGSKPANNRAHYHVSFAARRAHRAVALPCLAAMAARLRPDRRPQSSRVARSRRFILTPGPKLCWAVGLLSERALPVGQSAMPSVSPHSDQHSSPSNEKHPLGRRSRAWAEVLGHRTRLPVTLAVPWLLWPLSGGTPR